MLKEMNTYEYNYEIAKQEFPKLDISDWEHIARIRCYINLTKNEILMLQKRTVKQINYSYKNSYKNLSCFLKKLVSDVMDCFLEQEKIPPEKKKYRIKNWGNDIPINYIEDFDKSFKN